MNEERVFVIAPTYQEGMKWVNWSRDSRITDPRRQVIPIRKAVEVLRGFNHATLILVNAHGWPRGLDHELHMIIAHMKVGGEVTIESVEL